MALFGVKIVKTFLLYPPKVRSGLNGAIRASIAGLALTHTVGKAVLLGLVTSRLPFMRTPKCEATASLPQVLRLVWQEVLLLVSCIAALLATGLTRGTADHAAMLWMAMMSVQALPYAATLVTAGLSARATIAAARGEATPPYFAEQPAPLPRV